ncbi:PH domain-containing protein [Schumannella sp. 10F1B-5-1]|uniref:PH domain-containing protein n=1 Tax=Schumannella sp. 10F1B-5-1 TaxID=2590780 RepID=UPI001131D61E|nr:PH domain-containing protein [Schumannella sp. 10F1B-5-1]TPW71631.1 PH domain-containing protein [Schumannella sp. 10F1B-5-1]
MTDPREGASGESVEPVDAAAPAEPIASAEAAVPAEPVPDGELADDEWHRLHPATPLLRGGIALIAIIGFLIAQFRERAIDFVIANTSGRGGGRGPEDPLDWLLSSGLLPAVLGGAVLVIALVVVLFWLSWRMHTYRVTPELVEVRSGVLFRTHRKARLDRIQGINISRPVIARIFGAAKFEVQVAGDDANVKLDYLRSADADRLRLEVLQLASGAQAVKRAKAAGGARGEGGPAGAAAGGGGAAAATGVSGASTASAKLSGFVDDRVQEFLAPELDPNAAPPESVVEMHAGRLVGSTVVNDSTIWLLVLIAGSVVAVVLSGEPWILFTTIPLILAFGSFQIRKVTKFLRYTIASTEHGIRVGYGVLSTSNETIPPGRIHSISVNQPLLWRPFGWWHIRINRASRSGYGGNGDAQQQQNAVVLPVGSQDDALRVLELLLPGHDPAELRPVVESGFARDRGSSEYTVSPRRAAVLRWFSWRRNGFAMLGDAVLLRRGAIWRELVIVPFARMQSVSLSQGPLNRSLSLSVVNVHTVQGPISARLGALDVRDAEGLFRQLAVSGVAAAAGDLTHRWGASRVQESAAPAPSPELPGESATFVSQENSRDLPDGQREAPSDPEIAHSDPESRRDDPPADPPAAPRTPPAADPTALGPGDRA